MPESKSRKKAQRRPTPPKSTHVDRSKGPSPTWYVALMFGLMAVGMVLVVVRYVFQTGQALLLIGLGAIAIGFVMTTNYR
jgi:hypothetical protein